MLNFWGRLLGQDTNPTCIFAHLQADRKNYTPDTEGAQ